MTATLLQNFQRSVTTSRIYVSDTPSATATAAPGPSESFFVGRFLIPNPNDDSFRFVHPIPVSVITSDNECHVATFQEANVSASGETQFDAVDSLVSLITDVFSFLNDNSAHLGPEPARQLEVLRKYVAPRK